MMQFDDIMMERGIVDFVYFTFEQPLQIEINLNDSGLENVHGRGKRLKF